MFFKFNEIYVECDSVSVQTVRDVFQRVNDPDIFELRWTQPLPDDRTNTLSPPEDFLGNTSVTSLINIVGDYPNLIINPLALRSSQNSLTNFSVNYFQFGLQKDFNFLNGFDRLKELDIYDTKNLTAFQFLPPLPSLQILSIAYCPEINRIPFSNLRSAKLKQLGLVYNEITDQKADEIVANLVASNSAESLEFLSLRLKSLTTIPSQLRSAFPKLKEVYLGDNSILHIPSYSLTFAYPLESLDLGFNGLKKFESALSEIFSLFW